MSAKRFNLTRAEVGTPDYERFSNDRGVVVDHDNLPSVWITDGGFVDVDDHRGCSRAEFRDWLDTVRAELDAADARDLSVSLVAHGQHSGPAAALGSRAVGPHPTQDVPTAVGGPHVGTRTPEGESPATASAVEQADPATRSPVATRVGRPG